MCLTFCYISRALQRLGYLFLATVAHTLSNVFHFYARCDYGRWKISGCIFHFYSDSVVLNILMFKRLCRNILFFSFAHFPTSYWSFLLLIYKRSLYIKAIHCFSVPLFTNFTSILLLAFWSCLLGASHLPCSPLPPPPLAVQKLFSCCEQMCGSFSLCLDFVIILNKALPIKICHTKSPHSILRLLLVFPLLH